MHVTEAQRILAAAFGGTGEIEVDIPRNRLLIWATPPTHRQIQLRLEQMRCWSPRQMSGTRNFPHGIVSAFYLRPQGGMNPQNIRQTAGRVQAPLPLPQTSQPAPSSQSPPLTAPMQNQAPHQASRVMRSAGLQNLSAMEFEKKLIDSLGRRFVNVNPHSSAASEVVQYRLPLANGQSVEMQIDRRQNVVTVSGTPHSVDTFIQVIVAMDRDAGKSGVSTELLPFTPSNTPAVSEMIRAIGKTSQVVYQQETAQPSAGGTQLRIQPDGQLTGNVAQGFTIPGGSGLLGPVTVEILDDGVVVVRGNESDVKIVQEMLKHLETISLEYEPKILLHPLTHADSSRVATMLRQLYTDVYQTRKGAISITAMIKPNALLLIGYEGSIEAAFELLAKLDIAVDPESQFQVFRLRHAPVSSLQTSLQEFYNNRESLGTTCLVTTDTRTNALIVQGSPRDLLEIAALVVKLDVGTSEVVDQVKVIPLMNTLASDLAPIVQQAVTGTTSTQGFGGGNTTGLTGARSAVLSFQTIDTDANQTIRSDIFTDVRVTADSRGNNIIVVAPEKCMALIEALVRKLDAAPKAVSQIKVFTIVNSDAEILANMLSTLFATSQTGTAASQPAVRTGASASESSLIPVRFAVDSRTNSIVATGCEGDLNIVEAILVRLDERDLSNRRVVVYRLLNAPSTDVYTALNAYLNNERSLRQSTEVLVGDVDRFRSEVVVTDEPTTNSLIISTTPRYYEQVRRIIAELDERPPMVSIAVMIAEVTLGNSNELGFELGLQDSLLFDRSTLGDVMFQTVTSQTSSGTVQDQQIISSTKTPGFNWANPSAGLGMNASGNTKNVGSQGITNFALGRTSELGYSGFMFSASSESVNVLIRALEEQNRLTVLNKPTLTTMHNVEAFLTVGQSVQRITTTSETTSGGQNTNMESQDVGIVLKVIPRVSADGRIVMQIDASKSSLGAVADGVPIGVGANGTAIMSPNINRTQVQTTVSTSSGQTIVLGGLINEETAQVHRAVPWVSDIPLLGQLFQYNYDKCSRKEVLFIMTPRILRSDDEIQAMTQLETSRMAWVGSHVADMMGDSTVKKRTDDWSSRETVIERGDVFKPEEDQLIKSEEIINRSTIEGISAPTLAPVPPPRK
jgi:type II secretory pathway component GspD/PulD (secretin)